ncbi:hypothetical protein Naga_101576g2 [Nannochloropsis gaditana]|uniref:Uncharacterized protein n=1 Tax=Nannochloropsis gaditana TaxID=72520 RepID=W7T4S7_9STRA|nr:hypothetical protein Naga_101576g2 [Nannochloropsis gaditana]
MPSNNKAHYFPYSGIVTRVKESSILPIVVWRRGNGSLCSSSHASFFRTRPCPTSSRTWGVRSVFLRCGARTLPPNQR